jgi:hypothetical protein
MVFNVRLRATHQMVSPVASASGRSAGLLRNRRFRSVIGEWRHPPAIAATSIGKHFQSGSLRFAGDLD